MVMESRLASQVLQLLGQEEGAVERTLRIPTEVLVGQVAVGMAVLWDFLTGSQE